MNNYNLSDNYKHLWISGDIHGEIRALIYNLSRLEAKDTVVIVAGDCGIGFEKLGHYENIYHRIKNTLEKQNCILLLVRGNHDDPSFFREKLIDFPRMKTIPDYSIVSVANRNVLCVGGAISLDRYDRKQDIINRQLARKKELPIYWTDEYPICDFEKLALIANNGVKVDTVVTHSAPLFCYPQIKRNMERRILFDPQLIEDVKKERETLSALHSQLLKDNHPIKDWCYGHFHTSHIEFIGDVRFRLLDIDELSEMG